MAGKEDLEIIDRLSKSFLQVICELFNRVLIVIRLYNIMALSHFLLLDAFIILLFW